jgi:hypothetical protein
MIVRQVFVFGWQIVSFRRGIYPKFSLIIGTYLVQLLDQRKSVLREAASLAEDIQNEIKVLK